MQHLLFTNTFFEEELSKPLTSPWLFLQESPIHFHLHYLSCLLAEKNEIALLALEPEEDFLLRIEKLGLSIPSYRLLNQTGQECTLHSWGASSSLAAWALQNNCLYDVPDESLVKKVHSKAFSFLIGPTLKQASLLQTKSELLAWWKGVKGPKVLKTLYGSSGRGHFISKREERDLEEALLFLETHNEGLLAEPWVDRTLDFSSQWNIEKHGTYSYIGSTICENSPRGVYRKSLVGHPEILFKNNFEFLQEHLFYAEKAIQKIASLGFFGNIGIDSMLYKEDSTQKVKLHPIVEINARKTMGWAALKIHKKLCTEETLCFSYEINKKNAISYLPCFAIETKSKQKKSLFKAALVIEKLKP